MAKHLFKPGDKRPKGAGRKPGQPNRKTLEFMATLEAHNLDLAEAYAHVYAEQIKLYEIMRKQKPKALTPAAGILEKAAATLNNMCQYVYPKKKAIEHSGGIEIKTFADFILAAKGPR